MAITDAMVEVTVEVKKTELIPKVFGRSWKMEQIDDSEDRACVKIISFFFGLCVWLGDNGMYW